MKRDRLERAEQALESAMRMTYGLTLSMALDREADRIATERAEIDARELIEEALALRDAKR
jgi:hypothetical protein